jgi:hypothetical protein
MKHETIKQLLAEEGIDLAAGMTDQFATKFVKLHYRINRDIYKGSGDAASLDLKYEYDITEPLKFDFHPIDNAAEKVKRSILMDPLFGSDKSLFRQSFESPTLKISIPNTFIEFNAISSGDLLANLKVSVSVEAYIFITSTSPKEYSIRVISADIKIKEQKLFVKSLGDSGCALDKLIEHILANVLKDRLNRFIQSIDLPQPQDLISIFETELLKVEVVDNHLYLGLHAIRSKAVSSSNEFLDSLSSEDLLENVDSLQINMDQKESEIDAIMDVGSVSAKVTHRMIPTQLVTITQQFPSGDMFFAFSERVFQLLADKYLNIEEHKEKRVDKTGCYYFYRYWMKVWQPVVKLRQSALEFRAELAGGASGSAGLKGCSSWVKVEIGANATAEPYCHGRAGFYVKGKEFWLWPQAFPFAVKANAWIKPKVPGLGFVLSIVLSSILTLFTGIVLPLLTLGLRKKLMTLPTEVPGTNVPMEAKFSGAGNWEDKVFVAVAVEFPE